MKPIKTVLTLVLALMLVMSMTACSTAETKKEDDTPILNESVETSKPDVDTTVEEQSSENKEDTEGKEEVATTEPENTETQAPTVDEPLFDMSWANNEFEMMIPKPPFTGWVGEKKDDTTYEMEAAEIDPEGKAEYYAEFEAYAWSLQDYGFTVTGEFNEFKAVDAAGNVVELLCGDGYAWITIIKAP